MANSVDPGQTVFKEAVWFGSAQFAYTTLSETLENKQKLVLIVEWSQFLAVVIAEFYCIYPVYPSVRI